MIYHINHYNISYINLLTYLERELSDDAPTAGGAAEDGVVEGVV